MNKNELLLKEWLKKQIEYPKTTKDVCKIFAEVNSSTVEGWINSGKIPADKKAKQKLYGLTKLDIYKAKKEPEITAELFAPVSIFAPSPAVAVEKDNPVLEGLITETKALKEELLAKENLLRLLKNNTTENALTVSQIKEKFYTLLTAVYPLINDKALMTKFKEAVKLEDVAFLASLLSSILDDKNFELWKTFQKLHIKK